MFKYFVLSALVFGGCVSSQPQVAQHSSQPSWILNPSQENKIGAIGVSGRTYDGSISTQRKLAITRALEELSLQQGVRVNLHMVKSEKVQNNQVSSSLNTKSNFRASHTLSAHIEQVYMEKNTHQLYVWMVLD